MRARAPFLPTVIAAISLTIAACASPQTTAPSAGAPSSETSPLAETASSAPSIAPSPSASPSPRTVTSADVLASLSRPDFAFDSTVSGNIVVNGVSFPLTGSLALAHGDASNEVAVQLPAGEQRMSTLRVSGVTWTRTGTDGPWIEDPATTTNDDLGRTIATLSSLTDRGPATVEGRVLHRFDTGRLTAADLSITTPGISDFSGTLSLLVDDAATVDAIDLTASYRQPFGETTETVTLTFRCTGTGRTPDIEKPIDPWRRFTSKNGFSIAYPIVMTAIPATKTTHDVIRYSATDFVDLAREPQPKNVDLAQYAAAYAISWRDLLHVKPESMVEATMAGQPAIVMTFHATLAKPEYIIAGVTVKGRTGYYVALASAKGNEDNANSLFEEMLATYQLNS